MQRFRLLLLVLLLVFSAAPARQSLAHAGNIGQGSATCPSSGAKQLSSTAAAYMWISFQAPLANTGRVYFGGSAVTTSTGNFILAGGNYAFLPVANTFPYQATNIYFACTVSGDSITYNYLQ
jgi:hypothetical protein